MKNFVLIIASDYRQRTRSYAFLITLCISLAAGYSFIPSLDANYSTIRIGEYIGNYNSSWIGYVSAMMTSMFLSLIGFYLINSTIKNDITSKIGQIISATKISNFEYLLSKMLSNFLVLLTIALLVFAMSILLFFFYNEGYSFIVLQFIKPFCIITIPSLFFISGLAVLFEVIFVKYSILQNILFFFLFIVIHATNSGSTDYQYLDMSGTQIVTHKMEETVKNITPNSNDIDLSIGYILGNTSTPQQFDFKGIEFPKKYIFSRLCWMLLGLGLILISSIIFHRFRNKEQLSIHKKKVTLKTTTKNDIHISSLSKISPSYKIKPLLLTEFKLLIRRGNKWLWLLNCIGIIGLFFAPITIAHQMVLPVLWFLQVDRWSSLVTKEQLFNTYFFSETSYKPLQRHFVSQVLSGILLAILISLPLVIRYIFILDYIVILSIILGGILIVSFAVLLGLLSKGKKLFEILFFLLTYMNINKIPFTDYYGSLYHSLIYVFSLTLIITICLGISYFLKIMNLNR